MALQLGTIDFLVRELLPRLPGKGAVLSLSRQKVSGPVADVVHYLEKEGFAPPVLDDPRRMTSRELFASLGFAHYDDVDFTESEDCTLVHDMNLPIPPDMAGRYDLVFELGTLEHIFDIKTAFANIIALVKTGGMVFHLAPLDLVNHGFYNFSPTLYYDVYRYNGFGPPTFFWAESPEKWWKNPRFFYRRTEFAPGRVKPQARKGFYPMLAVMAVKEKDLGAFQTPIQAIYDPESGFDPVF